MKKQKVTHNDKYVGHIYAEYNVPMRKEDYIFTKIVMFLLWSIAVVFAGYIMVEILGGAVIKFMKINDDLKCHRIIDQAMEYDQLLSEYDVKVCR